jgi:hypothetical protein
MAPLTATLGGVVEVEPLPPVVVPAEAPDGVPAEAPDGAPVETPVAAPVPVLVEELAAADDVEPP